MISDEKVKKALETIKSSSDWVYFFNKINRPEWISALDKKSIFNNPPDQGVWPPLQYLKRMCENQPKFYDIIGKIIVNINPTDNFFTHCEYIDIIIKLPNTTKYKLEILKNEIKWLGSLSKFHPILAKKLGELLRSLSRDGLHGEALSVAEIALDLSQNEHDSENSFGSKVTTKCEWFQYQTILEKMYPELVNLAWDTSLSLLCNLLDKALYANRDSDEEARGFQDFSYIWRRRLESSNYHSQDIKDLLITAIIKSTIKILETDPSNLNGMLHIIEQYKWTVFGRIHLFLLQNNTAPDISKIEGALISDRFFDKNDYYHEYYLLLKKYFFNLTLASQEKITKRIVERDFSYLTDHGYTDDEQSTAKAIWQIKHLEPIQDHLPTPTKNNYKDLVTKYGEPESKGFYSDTPHAWIGPESPIGFSDLAAKEPKDLIDFLSKWEPATDKMFGPSKRGLGQILDEVITKSPTKYVPFIEVIHTLQEPTYVSATFSGLRNAINQGKTLPWEPIINLCLWVLDNQDQISPRDPSQVSEYNIDPDWTWTKHTIASLLYTALAPHNDKRMELYPFRDSIWKILEQLAEDKNPTLEDEQRYSDSEGYDSLAINSVRGEALHAVMHYALWQYHKFENELGKEKLKSGIFDRLPEVKLLLEKHLDVNHDPLLSTRTVFGKWLPWLITLDEKWVKNSVKLIFPDSDDTFKYRKAAWRTYIKFAQPYSGVFKIIKSEYDFWLLQLPNEDTEKDSTNHLAHHLMAFYWRGLVELNDLDTFFKIAAPATCSDAMSYIGLTLRRGDDEIPSEILLRFQALWEYRLATIQSHFALETHFHELNTFIWWFESMAFDLDWAFQQLKAVLELIKYPQHITVLLDTFKALVEKKTLNPIYLSHIVDCLDIMVKSVPGKTRSQFWHWDVELILEQIMLRAQDETVRSKVRDLINFIMALGYFDIKKLMQITPKASE